MRQKSIGTMGMISKLSNATHLSVHRAFFNCVENHLPARRFDEVGMREIYVPLYNRLVKANNKVTPKSLMKKRDGHIAEADKYYRLLRQSIEVLVKENGDVTVVCNAKILNDIFIAYGNITKKPLKDKLTIYLNFIEELQKNMNSITVSGVKRLYGKLAEEVLEADNSHLEIIMYKTNCSQNRAIDIRPQIDNAYRNTIEFLNNRWALEKDKFDSEMFMLVWSKKVAEFKNQYAIKEGGRISAKQRSEENASGENAESPAKPKKRYKLPIPRDVRFVDIDAGKIVRNPQEKEPLLPDLPGNPDDIPLYDPGKHYTEYKLGDLVRVENGDIYKVVNLGYVHYHPDSKYGHWGWTLVKLGS